MGKLNSVKDFVAQIEKLEKVKIYEFKCQFNDLQDYINHFSQLFELTVKSKSLVEASPFSLTGTMLN